MPGVPAQAPGALAYREGRSNGLGFHLVTILHNNGFPAEGLNAASSAQEKERFANLKAERYWNLRERFQRGEISGLSDEALGELASISYLIDSRGKTAIEDKASVRSALGRSPDLAEALMLALGEPSYEPFRFQPLLRDVPSSSPFVPQSSEATCKRQDDLDDMAGDSTFFVHSREQLLSNTRCSDSLIYGSLNRQGVVSLNSSPSRSRTRSRRERGFEYHYRRRLSSAAHRDRSPSTTY